MTEDKEEMLVVVDEEDRVVGYKPRVECLKNPEWITRTVSVALFNSKGEVLLQKRSKKKDRYPGYFTMSASGHVNKGESGEEAAYRELKEELGIEVSLEFFAKRLVNCDKREYVSYFKGYYEGEFLLANDEVESVKYFSLENLRELIKENKILITPNAKEGIEII